MRLRNAVSIITLMLFALTLPAAQPNNTAKQKKAWEFTDEERIALRLDPTDMAQRMEAHQAEVARISSHSGRLAPNAIGQDKQLVIDGPRNPELFLPFELFDQLLKAVDPRTDGLKRADIQAGYATNLEKFGFAPQPFWSDLARISKTYLSAAASNDELVRKIEVAPTVERRQLRDEQEAAPQRLCQLRFSALSAARGYYGQATFDRFLYTAVAPSLHMTSPWPAPTTAAGLRFIGGGCR